MAPAIITTPAEGNNKSNEDMTPVIPPSTLETFISTITGAITSIVASATYNVPLTRVNANAKKINSEINPYNTKSIDLTSKDRKLQWGLVTKKI